jgi:hypothetical protein
MLMKKTTLSCLIALAGILAVSCPSAVDDKPGTTPPPGSYSVTVSFSGPDQPRAVVYAAWIENESGKNIQNLYVCGTAAAGSLKGDALPNWKRPMGTPNAANANSNVDGVTGASTQRSKTFTRLLNGGSPRKFYICFEIDRSTNDNAYFPDRPAYTYRTALIDLDNLESSYTLGLFGWTANNTGDPDNDPGTEYSQQPINAAAVPEFVQYTLIQNTTHVGPLNEMVSTLVASIVQN